MSAIDADLKTVWFKPAGPSNFCLVMTHKGSGMRLQYKSTLAVSRSAEIYIYIYIYIYNSVGLIFRKPFDLVLV